MGAVEGIGGVRFTSPHPKDLRPETIEAMAETPEVCEQLHLPLQSGSDRVLSAMRRGYTAERYLARLARPGPPSHDLAVTTDIIVGLPGRDRGRLRAHPGRGGRGRRTTAPTPSSSRPARAPGPRPWRTSSSPADVIAERFERLEAVVERSLCPATRPGSGRTEEVLVEGVSQRDESMLTGRTRQSKLVHFAADGTGRPGRPRRGPWPGSPVTAGHPHHLPGCWSRSPPRPAATGCGSPPWPAP